MHSIKLTLSFDWSFWSVGVISEFADLGLTVVLVGPMRLNLFSEILG